MVSFARQTLGLWFVVGLYRQKPGTPVPDHRSHGSGVGASGIGQLVAVAVELKDNVGAGVGIEALQPSPDEPLVSAIIFSLEARYRALSEENYLLAQTKNCI